MLEYQRDTYDLLRIDTDYLNDYRHIYGFRNFKIVHQAENEIVIAGTFTYSVFEYYPDEDDYATSGFTTMLSNSFEDIIKFKRIDTMFDSPSNWDAFVAAIKDQTGYICLGEDDFYPEKLPRYVTLWGTIYDTYDLTEIGKLPDDVELSGLTHGIDFELDPVAKTVTIPLL